MIPENEATTLHQKAINAYRKRLNAMPSDGLAARRLALHVRSVEGDDAFVTCFVNECTPKLRRLGLLDAIEALGDWAIQTMDPQRAPERYLDELLSRIDAVPEHQGLHQCLKEACRTADEAAQSAGGGGRKTKAEP